MSTNKIFVSLLKIEVDFMHFLCLCVGDLGFSAVTPSGCLQGALSVAKNGADFVRALV